jgi:hypothetical protein
MPKAKRKATRSAVSAVPYSSLASRYAERKLNKHKIINQHWYALAG